MKVLLVNGSPNKDGCTNAALEEVARELAAQGIETEVFWLGRSAISGCIACRSCAKTGECFMDDGVNAFRAKAKEADGFIFGTLIKYTLAPIVFYCIGRMKNDVIPKVFKSFFFLIAKNSYHNIGAPPLFC